MEEIVLRWIERVGFPIFVACLSLFAVYKLFLMLLLTKGKLGEALEDHAKRVEELSKNSNAALGLNTLATEKLARTQQDQNDWWKGFGSDPFIGICKADLATQKIIAAIAAKESGISDGKFEKLIEGIDRLNKHAEAAAEVLVKKEQEKKDA